MTTQQKEILRDYVRGNLIYDLTNEPEFWADWIIEQAPNGDDWLFDYLDMDNRSPKDVESVVEALGFDPRTPTQPKTNN